MKTYHEMPYKKIQSNNTKSASGNLASYTEVASRNILNNNDENNIINNNDEIITAKLPLQIMNNGT